MLPAVGVAGRLAGLLARPVDLRDGLPDRRPARIVGVGGAGLREHPQAGLHVRTHASPPAKKRHGRPDSNRRPPHRIGARRPLRYDRAAGKASAPDRHSGSCSHIPKQHDRPDSNRRHGLCARACPPSTSHACPSEDAGHMLLNLGKQFGIQGEDHAQIASHHLAGEGTAHVRERARVDHHGRREGDADSGEALAQAARPGAGRDPRTAVERQRQPARLLRLRHGAGLDPGQRRHLRVVHREGRADVPRRVGRGLPHREHRPRPGASWCWPCGTSGRSTSRSATASTR